jgi:tannase
VWNDDTGSWELNVPSTGGEFVTKFVQLLDLDNLSNLDNVTYDTLEWMDTAMVRYMVSLQTTIPDPTTFQSSGDKQLHYHGVKSDPSIPSASSVHYWQSVLSVMYPNVSASKSLMELQEWYQLCLVPGAAHCGTNSHQPAPYPENNMDIRIN